ncbi:MAG: heme lyase CcmF/NrfE family subunit [Thermodesulfobacteriota bacterium]
MHYTAFAALVLSLAVLAGSVGYGFFRLLDEDYSPQKSVKILPWVQLSVFILISISSLILLWALGTRDFSFEYVMNYTDRFLPMFYALTAFWAGQDGSFLFWLWILSLLGVLVPVSSGYKSMPGRNKTFFWSFYFSIQLFFLLMLTGPSNPFIRLDPAPSSGNGLNPLLQNPGMIFHPPLLFIGYAGFAIPCCLAFASWLQGDEFSWMKTTRNWLMFAWITLTAGIILGAWWAYMELGWGGYWAWDPVENASLIPWLTATAFMHTAIIGRRRKALPRFSLFLISMTLVSCFFGTFLTRSGIIDSLHAFGNKGVGVPLLWIMFLLFLFTVFLVLSGRRGNKSLDHILGRQGIMLVAVWIFLCLAIIVAMGTIWPVLSQPFVNNPVGLDAGFYNRVCLPLFVLISVFFFICPWLKWKQGLSDRWGFMTALAVFFLSCAGCFFWGMRDFWPIVGGGSAFAGIFTILILFIKNKWMRSSRMQWGVYGIHLGIVLMVLGIAFSGPYSSEREAILSEGKKVSISGYEFVYTGLENQKTPGVNIFQANLEVLKDGRKLGELHPQKRLYRNHDQPFAEVSVLPSFGNELYSTLLGFTEDKVASVKISVNPLVNWIWLGGTITCILGFLGFDLRRKAKPGRQTDI